MKILELEKESLYYPSINPNHGFSMAGIDLVTAVVTQGNPGKEWK